MKHSSVELAESESQDYLIFKLTALIVINTPAVKTKAPCWQQRQSMLNYIQMHSLILWYGNIWNKSEK
jgi:hypothetical protein